MSNVNVKRLVENIRSGTNIYTPLVELVVKPHGPLRLKLMEMPRDLRFPAMQLARSASPAD